MVSNLALFFFFFFFLGGGGWVGGGGGVVFRKLGSERVNYILF